MAPGARSKFGVPTFEPEVFPKQMYCIDEITLLGLFGAPRSHSPPPVMRPGHCAPLVPLVTPLNTMATNLQKFTCYVK